MLEKNEKPQVQTTSNGRIEDNTTGKYGPVPSVSRKTRSERWADWFKVIRN
ncbi:MAG: hypothetical protein JW874_09980 [Spirochaetales bacterium]|nr:hypothetical protein [Spirochaetales bacterium]